MNNFEGHSDSFFKAIHIRADDNIALRKLATTTGIPLARLKYYNKANVIPTGRDLELICATTGIQHVELKLKMGTFDRELAQLLRRHANKISQIIDNESEDQPAKPSTPPLVFETQFGKLYQGDCLNLMRNLASDSIDMVFADPPFNLNKLYPSKIDDNLKTEQYLLWCEEWAGECVRLLKPGGSFFVWNLPKWNTYMAQFLNTRLTFKHWITADIKYRLPIKGRLYPSHYSLLYYCKGERASEFHPDRLPMEICPHCMGDLKDYGGYKNKMNPLGINLSDVWQDIPPVRHAKYKKRNGANELSIKLLDRIIEMASDEGDIVFDPFGGAGTTYAVAELKKRKWVGVEIGPVDDIVNRFNNISADAAYLIKIRAALNGLFSEETMEKRLRLGLWTPDTVRQANLKQSQGAVQLPVFNVP